MFEQITPKADMQIGFDTQVSDSKDDACRSTAVLNDLTGKRIPGSVGIRHHHIGKVGGKFRK